MKTAGSLAVCLAAAAVYAGPSPVEIEERSGSKSGSGALPTVTQRGNAFWAGNKRFYIKGIDYQPGGSSKVVDPLADETICARDIANFKKLGLNTIRVYTVDNSANHDKCMEMLAEAGIYLALDVNTPTYALNRNKPSHSYNPAYLQSVFATIDAFAGYSNLLLFFSGNEDINTPANTNCAPYVKAVTRDMKQYLGEQGYRAIPVGYSAADVSQNQYLMAQYMDCGAEQVRSDFYSINNYEWCDPSSFTTSGWNALAEQYSNYSIPVFMSEYGCNTNTRTFQETPALYKSDMTGSFSGGLVYEYTQEGDDFGIVTVSGNKVTPVGQQFADLQKEMHKVVTPPGDGGYHAHNPQQECPVSSHNWNIKPFTSSSLPATPDGAMKYFKNGAGKPPGLKGGSMDAPGWSTKTAGADAGKVTQTFAHHSTTAEGGGKGGGAASSKAAAVSIRHGKTELMPIFMSGVVVALGVAFGAAIF